LASSLQLSCFLASKVTRNGTFARWKPPRAHGFAPGTKSWHWGAVRMVTSNVAREGLPPSSPVPPTLFTADASTLWAQLRDVEPGSELGYWLRFFDLYPPAALDAELDQALSEERARGAAEAELQSRERWLRAGTADVALSSLHPLRDAAQLHQRVMSVFRVESRIVETLAVNRIAQSSSLLLLIRATGKAETQPVLRYFDTYVLLANVLEWGVDSDRGRRALARMQDIHSRYVIPSEGMKYILLETAFSWLRGADAIAHRPLLEVERLGFFNAYVELGQAMGIPELSFDYAAMLAWADAFNQDNCGFHESKQQAYERSVGGSLAKVHDVSLATWFRTCLRAAMDAPFREAVGERVATEKELQLVRRFVGNLGETAERLSHRPRLRSLAPNPAHGTSLPPERLGSAERSPRLPALLTPSELPSFTPEQVREHCDATSLWLIVDGEVLDLTEFAALHPGGRDVLLEYAGRDATVAFARAGHSKWVTQLRRNYLIGRVDTAQAGAF
jgi:hypothetical protein